MSVSLYEVSVESYLQAVGAVAHFLEKGKTYCEENGIDLGEVVETRLFPDMLPFRFQLVSVGHHSLGSIQGIEAGAFSPPGSGDGLDYAGLQNLIIDAKAGLEALTQDDVNAYGGKEVIFEIGDRKIPFTAENFVMTFSLPNLYFHAATAYDILRMKGVPLGKRDFMGRLRMKT
ncbi:MAG: DUF1993 domain-containing protein [Pseudomonadales bacterium]